MKQIAFGTFFEQIQLCAAVIVDGSEVTFPQYLFEDEIAEGETISVSVETQYGIQAMTLARNPHVEYDDEKRQFTLFNEKGEPTTLILLYTIPLFG